MTTEEINNYVEPKVTMELVRRDHHIDFLENTLIPDLKESGSYMTARDFEVCVAFMRDKDKEVIEIPEVQE